MSKVFHTLTSTHAKVITSDSERLIKMKTFLFLLQPSTLKTLHFFLSDFSSLIISIKQKRNLCLGGFWIHRGWLYLSIIVAYSIFSLAATSSRYQCPHLVQIECVVMWPAVGQGLVLAPPGFESCFPAPCELCNLEYAVNFQWNCSYPVLIWSSWTH